MTKQPYPEEFSDFVEVFAQRLNEHGGALAGRFELFFSALQGRWIVV